jgi:hypothetical protein
MVHFVEIFVQDCHWMKRKSGAKIPKHPVELVKVGIAVKSLVEKDLGLIHMRRKNKMKNEHITWSKRLFESIKEGGIWAVPRSGLIFKKHEKKFTLITTMPHVEGMPMTARQLTKYQKQDFKVIRKHFKAAGIPVVKAAPRPLHLWPSG